MKKQEITSNPLLSQMNAKVAELREQERATSLAMEQLKQMKDALLKEARAEAIAASESHYKQMIVPKISNGPVKFQTKFAADAETFVQQRTEEVAMEFLEQNLKAELEKFSLEQETLEIEILIDQKIQAKLDSHLTKISTCLAKKLEKFSREQEEEIEKLSAELDEFRMLLRKQQ